MRHRSLPLTAAFLACFLASASGQEWPGSGTPFFFSEFKTSPPAPLAPRPLICVDPGHPNSYSAAAAQINGTDENHINWAVALKLEKILKEKGFDVLLTKTAELESVENKERALIANRSGAALCVHLHCETTPGSGFAVYYPDRQGVYDYKDDPDNGFKGPVRQVMDGSLALARTMSAAMKEELSGTLPFRGTLGDSRTLVGERQGALTFSIFSKIPTVTIEMAVLTNKSDARFIKTEEGQARMAEAIASGILRHQTP